MMTRKRFNTEGGFTLAEAMLATLILVFVMASVLSVASQSARYLTDIRRTARASQVLQQEMENIRLTNVWTGLTGLANTSFSDPSDSNHLYAGSITESNYYSFGSTTTVEEVTLTVAWTNQVGKVLTNRLTTLVGYGGLNKYIY
jgi:type II secretory pathway pseudopilin PulG